MSTNVSNGRIDILSPNTNVLFAMQDKLPVQSGNGFREAMTGNWYDTMLSNAFFHNKTFKPYKTGLEQAYINVPTVYI